MFIDTHAHLDFPEFAPDLPEVVERARAAGITRVVCVGTDLESSRRAVELSQRFDGVYAVVGWHPGHALEAPDDIRQPLRELARQPRVVAIGETGLDYHRLDQVPSAEEMKQRQAALFRQQLEVAAELRLNCVIHQRDALEDTLDQFAPFARRLRGVFHCFVDPIPAMRRILELGSLVSFTGILTFKSAQNVRDVLAATPLDRFMLETDAPFLAPIPHRGKRCEPAFVKEIAAAAAEVRGCSVEKLSAATCQTAQNFFRGLN